MALCNWIPCFSKIALLHKYYRFRSCHGIGRSIGFWPGRKTMFSGPFQSAWKTAIFGPGPFFTRALSYMGPPSWRLIRMYRFDLLKRICPGCGKCGFGGRSAMGNFTGRWRQIQILDEVVKSFYKPHALFSTWHIYSPLLPWALQPKTDIGICPASRTPGVFLARPYFPTGPGHA